MGWTCVRARFQNSEFWVEVLQTDLRQSEVQAGIWVRVRVCVTIDRIIIPQQSSPGSDSALCCAVLCSVPSVCRTYSTAEHSTAHHHTDQYQHSISISTRHRHRLVKLSIQWTGIETSSSTRKLQTVQIELTRLTGLCVYSDSIHLWMF